MKRFLLLLLFATLLGCSKPPEERLFGLWKGMSRDDVNGCCQIDKTAMFTQNVSILELRGVPSPDPGFVVYYAHYTKRTGVFGVNANSLPMSPAEGEAFRRRLVDQMTALYGSPSEIKESSEVIWNRPPSPLGLFRVTVSTNINSQGRMIVGIFYVFDNNTAYT